MSLPDQREQRVLAAAEAAGRSLCSGTLARLTRLRPGPAGLYGALTDLLTEHAESLASLAHRAGLAGRLAGMLRVAARLPSAPPLAISEPAPPAASPPADLPPEYRDAYLEALPPEQALALARAWDEPPPDLAALLGLGDSGDDVQLPLIEEAALALRKKRLVTFDELRRLSDAEKRKALAVAGVRRQEAMGKLQEVMADSVAEGGTLRDFKRRVAEELPEGTFLSQAHVETAFRDATQAAYSAGMDAVLSDPLAGELFPYEETLPVRDSRLSSMCSLAARSGIGGGPIFRRDDPVWARIKPPRHPRCRCGRNPLLLEDAARRGVDEARQWLRTGRPPAVPAWVPMPAELAREGL